MKAISRCPKCGKKLETTCDHCIANGVSVHECKGEMDAVEVKWRIIDRTPSKEVDLEKELELSKLRKPEKIDEFDEQGKTHLKPKRR